MSIRAASLVQHHRLHANRSAGRGGHRQCHHQAYVLGQSAQL